MEILWLVSAISWVVSLVLMFLERTDVVSFPLGIILNEERVKKTSALSERVGEKINGQYSTYLITKSRVIIFNAHFAHLTGYNPGQVIRPILVLKYNCLIKDDHLLLRVVYPMFFILFLLTSLVLGCITMIVLKSPIGGIVILLGVLFFIVSLFNKTTQIEDFDNVIKEIKYKVL